jgi:hypothetical protein
VASPVVEAVDMDLVDGDGKQQFTVEIRSLVDSICDKTGSYLCVHEGPHQIRMEWMPTPLRAGMTLTDEPGLYLAGKFGVRIENTVLISDYMSTEFGKFLQIEPLTLCPIDTTPIDVDMLLPEEIGSLHIDALK